MNNIICVLTYQPQQQLIDFYETLTNDYDVYVAIDDNNHQVNVDKIKIIKIDRQEAIDNYFFNGSEYNSRFRELKAIAKDKALYYFYINKTDFDNIWFIEDDVYFYSKDIILNIDKKYPNTNFLAKSYKELDEPDKIKYFRKYYHKSPFSLPYYYGLICMMRCPKILINKVFELALTNKQFCIDEIMFHTLCINNKIVMEHPKEFVGIVYRRKKPLKKYKKDIIYHPIKDFNKQNELRELHKNNSTDFSLLKII